VVEGKDFKNTALVIVHDDEYPFCVRRSGNSMRIMVDGDEIRVAFFKDLQREPLSL